VYQREFLIPRLYGVRTYALESVGDGDESFTADIRISPNKIFAQIVGVCDDEFGRPDAECFKGAAAYLGKSASILEVGIACPRIPKI
jgi:hypothetical protein